MHDFCFTIPYGLILVCGGLFGYLRKGSLISLGGGAGAGLLLILAGYLSLQAFKKRKNSFFALILETGRFMVSNRISSLTVIATGLTYAMGQRYMETSKIMPAGIVSGLSAVMTMFYVYKVATGGNHFPEKSE